MIHSTNRFWWRLSSAIAGLVLAAASLVGCGSDNSSGGTQTIRYMVWDPNEAAGYKQVISAFEKLHPDINVQMEVVPWTSYWTKLYTEVSAGDAPDVFWGMPSYLPELVQKKAMAPLDDLISKDKVDLGYALPALSKSFQVGGKTYGIEKDWDALSYLYNPNALKAAGLSSAPQNLTWNPTDGGTFLQTMEKLTVDGNGKNATQAGFDSNNIKQYGMVYFGSNVDPADMDPWIYGNGGEIVDSAGKLQVNSPQNVATVTFLKDLITKYHVSPSYQAALSATPFSIFAAGKAAAWQSGPFEISAIASGASFKPVIGLNAAGPNGSWTRSNGLVDAISANTKHMDAAWQWVKFVASDQGQQTLGSTGVVMPAKKDGTAAMVDYWKKKGVDLEPFVQQAEGSQSHVVTDPEVNNFVAFDDLWDKVLGQVFSDQISVQQGLDEIQNQGSSLIK